MGSPFQCLLPVLPPSGDGSANEQGARQTETSDGQPEEPCARCPSSCVAHAVDIEAAAVRLVARPLLHARQSGEPLPAFAPSTAKRSAEVEPAEQTANPMRRRVQGKQSRPDIPRPDPAVDTLAACSTDGSIVAGAGRPLRHAQQLYASHLMKTQKLPGKYYEQRRKCARAAWTDLAVDDKERWLAIARGEVEPPQTEPARSPAALGDLHSEDAAKEVRAVGMLFTWNGDWGLQDDVVCTMVKEHEHDVRTLCVALSEVAPLKAVFQQFWQEVCDAARQTGHCHVSCAMELSTQAVHKGRVHLHAFMSLPLSCRGKAPDPSFRATTFQGKTASHSSPCVPGKGIRSRVRAVNEAHYYLQAEKHGSVRRCANYKKSVHFQVCSRWVLSLWRLRKLDHDAARREAILARDRSHTLVQDIDKQERLEYELWCQEQQKRARKGVALREFLPPVAFELEWLAQYAAVQSIHAGAIPNISGPTLRRFKTLVYDGPSRTGKSERALSWFTEEKTLKLNCQNVCTPNLHEFLTGKYSAILCEECTWQLLWNNKQLFQAAPCVVQLGQSQCNEHCYSVWCWGVPFMVCSNNFWKDSADKVARDWVEENIYYVRWDSPTWQP